MKRFLLIILFSISIYSFGNIDNRYLPYTESKSLSTTYYNYNVISVQDEYEIKYSHYHNGGPRRSLDFGDDDDHRGIGELLPLDFDNYACIFLIILGISYALYIKFNDKNKVKVY